MGMEKIGLPLEAMCRATTSKKIYKIFWHDTQATGIKEGRATVDHRLLHGSLFPQVIPEKRWDTDSWRYCQGMCEPPHHSLYECGAICKIRHQILGKYFITPDTVWCCESKKMAGFIRMHILRSRYGFPIQLIIIHHASKWIETFYSFPFFLLIELIDSQSSRVECASQLKLYYWRSSKNP